MTLQFIEDHYLSLYALVLCVILAYSGRGRK